MDGWWWNSQGHDLRCDGRLWFSSGRKPVSVHDLHATILHLMGYDHERMTYRYAGRDFRLTDVFGKVIQEIIA